MSRQTPPGSPALWAGKDRLSVSPIGNQGLRDREATCPETTQPVSGTAGRRAQVSLPACPALPAWSLLSESRTWLEWEHVRPQMSMQEAHSQVSPAKLHWCQLLFLQTVLFPFISQGGGLQHGTGQGQAGKAEGVGVLVHCNGAAASLAPAFLGWR